MGVLALAAISIERKSKTASPPWKLHQAFGFSKRDYLFGWFGDSRHPGKLPSLAAVLQVPNVGQCSFLDCHDQRIHLKRKFLHKRPTFSTPVTTFYSTVHLQDSNPKTGAA